jgi:transcription antitermination factor NusG
MRIETNPPSIYPQGSEIADLAATGVTWFLFTAKYQSTARLAFDLFAQRINFYLPLVRSTKTLPNGERAMKPLLGRYIFVALRPDQFANSSHIDRTKFIADDWQLLPALANLKAKIDSGEVRSLYDLKKGDLCRIKKDVYRDKTFRVNRIDKEKGIAYLLGLVGDFETEVDMALVEAG